MKIIFIKPKTDLHVVIPPLSFLFLSAHLKNHNVKIIDAHQSRLSDEEIIEKIKEFNPDLIGFGGLSCEINHSLDLAKKIREVVKAKIVFGGVHTTNCPTEILEKEFVDFIFRAEADIPLAQFVTKLEKNEDYTTVPNLGYKDGTKLFFNDIKIYGFDSINMPSWELINLRDYPKQFINKKHPSGSIFTSRGCPFFCTFCSSSTMSKGKYRERDIDKVIDELKYLKHRFGIKEFNIWDDNFTLNKSRVHSFCDKLIENKLNLVWNCPNGVRIDTLDDLLLKKMKKAGCWSLSLPVEFGTQRMLDITNKKTNLKRIKKIIPLVEKNGIRAFCFFIIGHPEETPDDIKETIKLSKSLPISGAYFSIFKVLQGSPDYYKFGAEKGSSLFSYGNKKIKRIQRYALLSFYLRPKQLFTFISNNLSMDQFKCLLRVLNRFVFKNKTLD